MSDTEPPARLAIEMQYARLGEAVRHKDLDALRALHMPAYRELEISGQERDLEAVIAEWHADFVAVIEPTFQADIDDVDLDGDEAKVAARSVLIFLDAPSAALRYGIRIETTRRDCWIKTDAGWRLGRSEKQTIKSWIDDNLDRETTSSPPLTAEQRAAVVRDLCARALPFKSVLAGNGFDDLAGLDRLIGDARIVALGEATHGTAEFFQMKHRLLEYLVERKGFTVFAIEGNWPEAEVADRFIQTGEGDAGAALATMRFWTWQTMEVAALLTWMRRYNATPSKRPALSFTGFDMQYPQAAATRAIDILHRAGSADRDAVRALYDGIERLDKPDSDITAAQLVDGARKALALIDEQGATPALTADDNRDLRQAARIVLQALEMRTDIGERDRAMAENVRWLLEERFPGRKIVLWAHNRHIGTNLDCSARSLGDHLRDRYGDQMAIIGFATHHGEVRAVRMKEGKFQRGGPVALPLPPTREVSVETLFQEAGLSRFILDLRNLPTDSAVGAWLAKPRSHREMGAVYDPDRDSNYYEHVCLPAMFDCVVFIAESTAAKPLKSGAA